MLPEAKRCSVCGSDQPLEAFHRQRLGKHGRRANCKECSAAYNGRWRNNNAESIVQRQEYRRAHRAHHETGPRICTKCGQEKPLDQFSRHRNLTSGRRRECKACQVTYNLAWRHEQTSPRVRERAAANGEKSPRALNGQRAKRDPVKTAAQKKAWRLANPEKVRAHKQAHHKRHREKIVARVTAWQRENPVQRRAQHLRRRSLQAGAAGAHYTTAEHIAGRWELYGGRCYYCGAEAEATDHRIPLARGGSHWPANLVPCCKSCNSRKHARNPKQFREGVIPPLHVGTPAP